MKDFKEEHIDPEQYWPEAEKLLDKHYTAKRSRSAYIMIGAVLVGLLSLYFLNTENSNLAEKNNSDEKVIVNKNLEQNKRAIPNEKVTTIPSKEIEKNKIQDPTLKQSTLVENEMGIANVSRKNQTSANKIKANNVTERNEKSFASTPVSSKKYSSSTQSNSTNGINVQVSTASSTHGDQTHQVNTTTAGEHPPMDQYVDGNALPITETNIANVDYISSMPLLKWKKTPFEEAAIQRDSRPELHTKKKAKWDLLIYAGLNDVQKELSGKSSSTYLLRREKEETPALLPFGGLQLSRSINNWDFRGGLEFNVVGEQVKYSPYAKGDYLNVYDDWVPNNYVVTDTDSAYIWGILFLNTTDYTVMDSVKVTITDTLNGVYYNSNIRNANGINRWYVMELPLEVLYQFRMKRWGIGISAGVAPGLVVQSSGYYLKEDESGYTSIKKYNKQQFTLNARAGLEFSYLLNTRCRLLLRPTSQYSLLKMDAGTNERQRYRRNGISLGLLYMIP
ncbi:MAG: hypothetical protein IPK10_18035 [Bacteroidetes bacterium]|nr:hypothetical protein [Bacteroidota bacterium]